ncbi:MAG: cyanophycinase [Planctomycetaceae bacterium]
MKLALIWLCCLTLGISVVQAADSPVVEPSPKLAEDADAPKGSLVIIGGSERFRDRELWDTIVELAGGDGAKIAVFPTAASGQPIKSCAKLVQTLNRAGADAFVVPVAWSEVDRDIQKAVFDPELVERVRSATGIYFIGGAQGRIVDALLDDNRKQTPMLQAIWDVYRRGGVIAGTSAGAAIMSQVMFRDAPPPLQVLRHGVTMGNEIDDGLGFLDKDWFVEQHCLVRGRFARALVAMHSQKIPFGIGVDENTALVVKRGVEATVIGYKGVLIMDLSQAKPDSKMDEFSLKNVKMSYLDRGDSINLRTREVTPADEKRDDIKLDPNAKDFKPYFDHRMFYTDILGNAAVADLLGRLIDNKESEAIGLAFSGLDSRHEPSDGFEFRFYRGPDSKGWYTEDYGGEDYTVLDIHLDIRPIRIAGPLYEHRMATEETRRETVAEATESKD